MIYRSVGTTFAHQTCIQFDYCLSKLMKFHFFKSKYALWKWMEEVGTLTRFSNMASCNFMWPLLNLPRKSMLSCADRKS